MRKLLFGRVSQRESGEKFEKMAKMSEMSKIFILSIDATYLITSKFLIDAFSPYIELFLNWFNSTWVSTWAKAIDFDDNIGNKLDDVSFSMLFTESYARKM